MDFKVLQNESVLDKESDIISFRYPHYKRWASLVLPQEEINIQELLSQYQSSVDSEIQSLKNQVNVLGMQIATQFQTIQSLKDRRVIPIQNLRSRKLRLINALYVNVEHDDNIYVVFSEDLNLYGYGGIELNAVRDFCKEIENLYFDLKESSVKLGKAMKENWNFLKEIIKEK